MKLRKPAAESTVPTDVARNSKAPDDGMMARENEPVGPVDDVTLTDTRTPWGTTPATTGSTAGGDRAERAIREQPTEQSGKPCLPVEGEVPAATGEEEDAEPVFTEAEMKELFDWESRVRTGTVEAAEAMEMIRKTGRWRAHRGEDGRRRFKTYDEYCEEVHGHPRQWVSQQTKWAANFRSLEKLRHAGRNVPDMISAKAANGLIALAVVSGRQDGTDEEREEAGLAAVLEEASESGGGYSYDSLRRICQRRYDYYCPTRPNRPAGATYNAYKDDLALLGQLNKVKRGPGIWPTVQRAVAGGMSIQDALAMECKQAKAIPSDEELLSHATGADLQAIVDFLASVAQSWETDQRGDSETAVAAKGVRRAARPPRSESVRSTRKKAAGRSGAEVTPPTSKIIEGDDADSEAVFADTEDLGDDYDDDEYQPVDTDFMQDIVDNRFDEVVKDFGLATEFGLAGDEKENLRLVRKALALAEEVEYQAKKLLDAHAVNKGG
jgi:hypothetical protein